MRVDLLSSDNVLTLVVEGHVELAQAEAAARVEGYYDYPPFQHGFMRFSDVPEGEDADWWREPCAATDDGAEAVTYTQKGW